MIVILTYSHCLGEDLIIILISLLFNPLSDLEVTEKGYNKLFERLVRVLGEPHLICCHFYLGIARLGGGLNACPNGLGQLFREVQTGICLILGGSKPLPGWFGAQ